MKGKVSGLVLKVEGDEVITLSRQESNLLIYGKSGSGKTNLLNAMVSDLTIEYDKDELIIYWVDFKGLDSVKHIINPRVEARNERFSRHWDELQRDIESEIEERIKVFNELGVVNYDEYEKVEHLANMRQKILVILDDYDLYRDENEIERYEERILRKIMRLGGTVGVYFIMTGQYAYPHDLEGFDNLLHSSIRTKLFGNEGTAAVNGDFDSDWFDREIEVPLTCK